MSIPQSETTATAPPPSAARVWRVGTLTYGAAGLAALFCWLIGGDFAWQMRDRALPAVVQLLLKRLGSSDMTTGLLLFSLPSLLAFVLGPVVGTLSDRHRGRLGRRIPFLLATAPVAVVAIAGLAFSPGAGAWLHRLAGPGGPGEQAWVLLFFGASWVVFELSSVTANAIFGGLVNDVVPPELVGRFYGLFRAASLAAGMIFNFWLIGSAEEHSTALFLGIGGLYAVGFTTMCLGVKEGRYPTPPPLATGPGRIGAAMAGARDYFRECFGHVDHAWFFAFYTLAGTAILPVNLFALFYAKSVGLGVAAYGKCLALTYLLSLLLSYPLGSLADRFHPLRVALVVMALYVAVAAWGACCARTAATFSIAFVVHGVLAGSWLTASASLGQRLLPRERFAQIFSAAGACAALGTVVGAPLVGLALDRTGHLYPLTFALGSAIALLALGAGLALRARRLLR